VTKGGSTRSARRAAAKHAAAHRTARTDTKARAAVKRASAPGKRRPAVAARPLAKSRSTASKAGSAMMRVAFSVNGRRHSVSTDPRTRLTEVLREQLGLTGTKVGCDAGDCGACTVLLNGQQVCACMVPAGRLNGSAITTVEGLEQKGHLSKLQAAFHVQGAAQCGICTPGMLMAASDLLVREPHPTRDQALDALGGVLCRCTGYLKIVDAVLAASSGALPPDSAAPTNGTHPEPGHAVGARIARTDGLGKVLGSEKFGADNRPPDALWLRAVRSPHARAGFTVGDLAPVFFRHPGLVRVLTWKDIPGQNRYGIYPHIKDQPVLAEGQVRYRGEAVLALVGDKAAVYGIADSELQITWSPEAPLAGVNVGLAPGAPRIHETVANNVLCEGHVEKGNLSEAFSGADLTVEGEWETQFVEHAYVEPEAGYARRVGDRIEIVACTQTPYMDRDEIALILGLKPEQVHIVPTGIGGGFGGKLDLSLQPLIGTAAWVLKRTVRCIYSRPESMASTTKRHPSKVRARFAANREGLLQAIDFSADFNTGAYASWGPTVASRVPVHATGPYFVPAMRAHTRAVYTNDTPAGAFRGFGTPQAALAHEGLMDELAERLGRDRLELRLANAIRAGQPTNTGQVLTASVGMAECLRRLQPYWQEGLEAVGAFNKNPGPKRQGMGIGCMWYGIGNTSLSNPSTIRVGVGKDGSVTLFNGAVDIGQGSSTILAQICADALGIAVDKLRLVTGDTDLTADAGKTSASRQTFVSGKAAELAGRDLRKKLLTLADAPDEAQLEFSRGAVRVTWNGTAHTVDLRKLPVLPEAKGPTGVPLKGIVVLGTGTFDPPTTPQDAKGQGNPYATYAFAAQIAQVEVDVELGTTKVVRMVAAHDVGRAVNPIQVEGQIHGGIAQGLGMALMEEFIPGRTENLHDYLIPTFGDMPRIDVLLVEDNEPLAAYGAKGVGEPALVPAAPAILGAIRHATGARIHRLPATPDRVRQAILAARGGR
jgi:aldehyde oxidoreductase